ncbi:MAG: hypothetical protein HC844_04025 [Tabrizicola sp.]|nr:hypothetical protein [Tabrizicola sp.]
MKHDLERLAGLSQMILDDRLGILRRAAQARRQSQDQLAALDAGMPCQDDVPRFWRGAWR